MGNEWSNILPKSSQARKQPPPVINNNRTSELFCANVDMDTLAWTKCKQFSGWFWRNLSLPFEYFVVLSGRWTYLCMTFYLNSSHTEHGTNFPHVSSRGAWVVHSSFSSVVTVWRQTPGELSASTFFFFSLGYLPHVRFRYFHMDITSDARTWPPLQI